MYKVIRNFALSGSTIITSLLAVAMISVAASKDKTYSNVATGFCLDSNPQGDVYTLSCNGGDYQKWAISKGKYGYFFKNTATGLCLDSNPNGNVYTLSCNGGSYQQWNISKGRHANIFKNVATGFCLDSNTEGKTYTLGCNGGSYQQWY